MGLILVFHDTASPALYGAIAASVAVARGIRFMHVAARFDITRHADAEQHVVACGGLVGSGLLWFERLSGEPVSNVTTVDMILEAAQLEDLVVPIHPALLADADVPNTLMAGAQSRKIDVETITVSEDASCFRDTRTQAALAWRDRFGRIGFKEAAALESAALTIGLIGVQSDHRNVYPAVLACIADAADSLSIPVDIRFVEPFDDHKFDDSLVFEGISAILLPGGADMKNVRGQIAAAALTLQSGLPTVGLCLGMQTMVTAVAWKAFGRQNANLAEADASAGMKTFVAMANEKDAGGNVLPTHRTGDHKVDVVLGTHLSAIVSADVPMRYNHRFRLNPDLLPDLEASGLRISARGLSGAVVDAIEVPDHPFFMGMQGHPELSSRPSAPHPLIVAFLQAAAREHQRSAS
jgi:CTP synthase